MTTLGFERGSSSTTGHRRFLKEWDVIVSDAKRLHKNEDLRVRDDLVRSWQRLKIMEINGFRALTDSLNNTHDAALLARATRCSGPRPTARPWNSRWTSWAWRGRS